MPVGEIVHWNNDRGFGFLRSVSPPGPDVYARHRLWAG